MGTAEQTVAATIAKHRTELGLTYEQLAERMRMEGVNIHQSAIQKTEKSGRRVNIDEMVAYAKVFGIPVEELWGGRGQDAQLAAGWQALIDAETLNTLIDYAQSQYRRSINKIRDLADQNPTLKAQIEARLNKYRASAEPKAREMAAKDGVDISTPALFEKYLWGMWADSAMEVARDALGGGDDGE